MFLFGSCAQRPPSPKLFSESQKMFAKQNTLAKTDPELWAAIQNENRRQEDHIEA